MKHFQLHCGVNILLVAYRGYSHSEGDPTEAGLQKDSLVFYLFNRDIKYFRLFLIIYFQEVMWIKKKFSCLGDLWAGQSAFMG